MDHGLVGFTPVSRIRVFIIEKDDGQVMLGFCPAWWALLPYWVVSLVPVRFDPCRFVPDLFPSRVAAIAYALNNGILKRRGA